MNYDIKNYAYLGDAVWEIIIRKVIIQKTTVQKKMHKISTMFVCAEFQADLLNVIMPLLSEEEQEVVKRARNIKLGISKKNNPKIHTLATAFETLIGYLYIEDKEKYNLFEKVFTQILEENL